MRPIPVLALALSTAAFGPAMAVAPASGQTDVIQQNGGYLTWFPVPALAARTRFRRNANVTTCESPASATTPPGNDG